MTIQILDTENRVVFKMVFAYETDQEFIKELVGLTAKHKITNEKTTQNVEQV